MGLMFHSVKETDPYYGHWLELHRRTRVSWVAFLAWAPVSITAAAILQATTGLSKNGAFLGVALAAVAVAVAVRYRQVNWPCPRCGRAFYLAGIAYRPVAGRCVHCGLLEYAADGTG